MTTTLNVTCQSRQVTLLLHSPLLHQQREVRAVRAAWQSGQPGDCLIKAALAKMATAAEHMEHDACEARCTLRSAIDNEPVKSNSKLLLPYY